LPQADAVATYAATALDGLKCVVNVLTLQRAVVIQTDGVDQGKVACGNTHVCFPVEHKMCRFFSFYALVFRGKSGISLVVQIDR
jgi:hypothetical protein